MPVILFGTSGLLRDSATLALEAVPEGIEPVEVETYFVSSRGTSHVHDPPRPGMSTIDVALPRIW